MQIEWYDEIDPEFKDIPIETPFSWEIVCEFIFVYGKPRAPYGYVPGNKFWYARVPKKEAVAQAKKAGVPLEDYLQALVQLAEVRFHSKWTT